MRPGFVRDARAARPGGRRLAWLAAAALSVAGCSQLAELGLDRRPLTLEASIDPATRGRLLRTTRDPAQCRAWLAQAGVAFTPMADRAEGEFCVVSGAGALGDDLGDSTVRLSPREPMMTCRLAAALAVWRRQSVEPAALELLGASVSQIDHLGVYACRRMYSQPDGRASAHARAAAIDVAGFRLSDGRRVTLADDWAEASPEARFLRRVRDDACRVFGITLSPDYNAAHADHFHLEAGRGRICA